MTHRGNGDLITSNNVETESRQAVQQWKHQGKAQLLKSSGRLKAVMYLRSRVLVFLFVVFLVIRFHECLAKIKGNWASLRRREGPTPRDLAEDEGQRDKETSRMNVSDISLEEVCDMVLQMEDAAGLWRTPISVPVPVQVEPQTQSYLFGQYTPAELSHEHAVAGSSWMSQSYASLLEQWRSVNYSLVEGEVVDLSIGSSQAQTTSVSTTENIAQTSTAEYSTPQTKEEIESVLLSLEAQPEDADRKWSVALIGNVPMIPSDEAIGFPQWVIHRDIRKSVAPAASFAKMADRIAWLLESPELSPREAYMVLHVAHSLVTKLDMRSFELSNRQSTRGLCLKWGSLCHVVYTLHRVKCLFPRISAPEHWWIPLLNTINIADMQLKVSTYLRLTSGTSFAIQCANALAKFHAGGVPTLRDLKELFVAYGRFHSGPTVHPADTYSSVHTSPASQYSSLTTQTPEGSSTLGYEGMLQANSPAAPAGPENYRDLSAGTLQPQSAFEGDRGQPSTSQGTELPSGDPAAQAATAAAAAASSEIKTGMKIAWDNPQNRCWNPELVTSKPVVPSEEELISSRWRVVSTLTDVISPISKFVPCADSITCMLESKELTITQCRVLLDLSQTLVSALDFRCLRRIENLPISRLSVRLGACLHIVVALYRVKQLFPVVTAPESWWGQLLHSIDLTMPQQVLQGKRKTKAFAFAVNCITMIRRLKAGKELDMNVIKNLLTTYRACFRA